MTSQTSLLLPTTIKISQVNSLTDEDFIIKFGNVIEHCSLVAAAVAKSRPFQSLQHLHAEICSFIDELPVKGREGILRSHPDLAGRAAMAGKLTQESRQEQECAGLGSLTEEERSNLNTMNKSYRQKFGFPFVICARLNKKEAILLGLRSRLHNSPEEELHTGIEEVKKIALLRLKILVSDDMGSKM